MTDVDALCVNTLRTLSVDQVERAKSGHPGMPLGAAPMAYVLWDRFLKHDPTDPAWPDRDRFILSAGHGSALLYALLHLYGYDLPLEELKRFRQWGSRTPGHPEYGHVPGVEATTGPLGQGFAMGVGMAIAEAHLAAVYNRPGHTVVDHFTYAIVSDGDLMEGASHEAASLAGTLGLGKIVYLYDSNRISIEGSTDLAFTEDVGRRFEAYGWQVLRVEDGNDLGAIESAIAAARQERGKPSLVMVRTHIGYGSPKQDSAASHGEPLGVEAAKSTKRALGWPEDASFHVPGDVSAHCRETLRRGARSREVWRAAMETYRAAYPGPSAELEARLAGTLPDGWEAALPVFRPGEGAQATRTASGAVLNALAAAVPALMGGSADLAPSTKTLLKGSLDFSASHPEGRNLRFGVRELAMGAAVNGMALHGGVLPYGATFLVFCDFARPALRLAALMGTHAVFVFTHDSIGVGEDGPTHQPIEHLLSLRAIPGLRVLRPADANETAQAWRMALRGPGPTVLALTRQNLPVLDPESAPMASGFERGGYVLREAEGGAPQVVLAGTGSEVHAVLAARDLLGRRGIRARVVSLPCVETFLAQPEAYRREVLPPSLPCLAAEAGVTRGWREVVGDRGDVIGVDRFGASAPGEEVFRHLGLTPEAIAERAVSLLASKN
ncbi:MAG: transketolase [Acidobacteriota bacterium]